MESRVKKEEEKVVPVSGRIQDAGDERLHVGGWIYPLDLAHLPIQKNPPFKLTLLQPEERRYCWQKVDRRNS